MRFLKFEMLFKGSNGWEFTAFGWTFFCWHAKGMAAIRVTKTWRERISVFSPAGRRMALPAFVNRFARHGS